MQSPGICPHNGETGFSLIEVMVALLLSAFGLLAVGQLLGASINCMSLARSKETSILAARNKLEELRDLYRCDPSHADLSPGDHGPEEITVRNPINDDALNRFRITWSMENVSDPRPGKSPAAISATVTTTPSSDIGDPVQRPRYSRTILLTTILSPKIR